MLVSAQGGRRSPTLDRSDEGALFISRIHFSGPFPEAATFRIELPDGLTDETGRPLANANRFPLQVKTAEFPVVGQFEVNIECMVDPRRRSRAVNMKLTHYRISPPSQICGAVRHCGVEG